MTFTYHLTFQACFCITSIRLVKSCQEIGQNCAAQFHICQVSLGRPPDWGWLRRGINGDDSINSMNDYYDIVNGMEELAQLVHEILKLRS